jgi:phosphoribosyl-ATP pyrophosphohydrolase
MSDRSIVHELMAVIADRRANPPARSYVATLSKGGIAKIGPKITEEAQEVVEAAGEPGEEGRVHLVREVADLLFHTLVLLGEREIAWAEIEAELGRRFGVSGIDEKAARGGSPVNPPREG